MIPSGMNLVDNYVGPGNGGVADWGRELAILNSPSLRRPFVDNKDQTCVIIHTGRWTIEKGVRVPIKEKRRVRDLMNNGIIDPCWLSTNATSMRKEDWIELDRSVYESYRLPVRAWADLAAAKSYRFNGYGKMTLEYEAMNDHGEAIVDMDAMSEGRTDEHMLKLRSMPLPITHTNFTFSDRRLAVSSGMALDSRMAEAGGTRIGESVENNTIGMVTGASYGYQSAGVTAHDSTYLSKIYGYKTFPSRNTKTDLTTPTGTNPNSTVNDVLNMRQTMYGDRCYGPYMIYHSTDWDQYLDNDYYVTSTGAPYQTLRNRIRAIEGVMDVRRLDFLTDTFTFLMIDMSGKVARAVIGMDLTTMMWPSMGGLRINWKIMCIKVPQIFADYSDRCGILHATTS